MALVRELVNKVESLWDSYIENKMVEDASLVGGVIELLDSGIVRACDNIDGGWRANEWVKKAILLYFSSQKMVLFKDNEAFDKIPLKFSSWEEEHFMSNGIRMVPGAVVRKGAYIAPKCVLMPSFVNIGAYIDTGTLIDTWATVGSCAQIGKNCHISGGTGIGGVLEPIQANPVVIEDDVFIGARSEIAEGVIVGKGSVISMGVYIGQSTRIYDRQTGEVLYGRVPEYSVVVPGTLPGSDGVTQTYAAIIVKKVDAKTREKTQINQLLRE